MKNISRITLVFGFLFFMCHASLAQCDSSITLTVPTVFSPNSDNNNDGFNVESDCIYSLEKNIYNRWGQLLFHSQQINEPWNGRTTSGAEAPEGTYFYIINVGFYENGVETTKVFKGTVSLLR
jgi:gliding motility-associated-like protein